MYISFILMVKEYLDKTWKYDFKSYGQITIINTISVTEYSQEQKTCTLLAFWSIILLFTFTTLQLYFSIIYMNFFTFFSFFNKLNIIISDAARIREDNKVSPLSHKKHGFLGSSEIQLSIYWGKGELGSNPTMCPGIIFHKSEAN